MKTKLLKNPAIIRAGFEYQDLMGIEILLDFYRDPGRYHWVELEAEDKVFGALDDVVAARSDGAFEFTQVKFTADTDKYYLDWEWLLAKKPKGTSLLKKWSDGVERVSQLGPIFVAQLRTNRRPAPEIETLIYQKKIQLDAISTEQRGVIIKELGSEQQARAFFAMFEFSHSERMLEDLEFLLRGKIVPTDTDASGWLLLRQQARNWSMRRSNPEPDGKIRHEHLVQIITKGRPRPIPQDFQVPAGYVAPSKLFDESFQSRVRLSDPAIWILWGTPGRGKSTYLSYLVGALRTSGFPVIRHHYFISLDDSTTDRISFTEIASSLMNQLAARYPDAVRNLEFSVNQLRNWIQAAGKYYANESKRLVIVVDGLDHVWREQMNIEQMSHLFNYLLPLPPNVVLLVGTQRVADNQLPYRMLQEAGSEAWLEIPRMDEGAVFSWVKTQTEAGRILYPDHVYNKDEHLGALTRAFFKTSGGHPLHLIYSFEALVRRGVAFSTEEITLLPACPDGDIRKYYRGLWARLSATARRVLHLIAGSDFHWPADGIQDCVGEWAEVDNLVEHRRTGVIPFHGSILAYVREQPDHETVFKRLLPVVVDWLEATAPPYWRWAWLWLTKARLGEPDELIANTTRAWAVESLGAGWPIKQIVDIVRGAERQAFERFDLPRTLELRSLKIRLLNAPEFQTESFAAFEEAAIRTGKNEQRVLLLADEIAMLRDDDVLTLARSVPEQYRADIGRGCVDELRERVNIWINLRHRSDDVFIRLTKSLFEANSLITDIDTNRALNFIGGFAKPEVVVLPLMNFLARRANAQAILDFRAELTKRRKWALRLKTDDHVVRIAARLQLDLAQILQRGEMPVSPMMSCWLIWTEACKVKKFQYQSKWASVVKERYEYGANVELELFFHEVFFSALAVTLVAEGDFSFVLPGFKSDEADWLQNTITAFEEVAKDVGSRRIAPSFQVLFERMAVIEPVADQRPSDPAAAQYRSFRSSLPKIAYDLQGFADIVEGTRLIGPMQLEAARRSCHWSDDRWLFDDLDRATRSLDPAAAQSFIAQLSHDTDMKITEFNQRADRWIELARFALLYGLEGKEHVRRAANCLLGYGWRKDMGVFDVIQAIEDIDVHDKQESLDWLRTIIPIVDKITEFTDGDETDHARSELINLISNIAPEKLGDIYVHHIKADEWRYASKALHSHLSLMNFSHPVASALTGTMHEGTDIGSLGSIAANGNEDARNVYNRQMLFTGGIDKPTEKFQNSEPSMDHADGPLPDPKKFKPNQFSEFATALSDHSINYKERPKALKDWLYYWRDRGKATAALSAIEKYFESNENPHPAEDLLERHPIMLDHMRRSLRRRDTGGIRLA